MTAEKSEISIHEVLVVRALRADGAWKTHKQIQAMIPGRVVSDRTVRHHVKRLVALGLVDQAEVFPQHRYRWSQLAEKRNLAYVNRLDAASEVFGPTVQA